MVKKGQKRASDCNLLVKRENTSIVNTQTPKCVRIHTVCSVTLQLCNMVDKDKVSKKHDRHEIMSKLTKTRKV
jgi:hypothetical protein